MSLIQEALRRQQEDMDDNDSTPAPAKQSTPEPAPTDPPTIARTAPVDNAPPNMDTSAPPPVQQPPQMEDEPPPPPPEALEKSADTQPPPPGTEGKDSKTGLKVAMIILAAVVCLGVGIWAVSFGIQHFLGPSVETGTDTPPDTPVEAPPPVVEDPVAEPPVEPVEPVEPVSANPVEPAPPVNNTPTTPPPAAPPVLVKEPVVWPILTVNGFVGKGSNGAAIIDGSIVGVNESVMGVKIVSIDKSGVTLSYKGETKVVRKDQTTE